MAVAPSFSSSCNRRISSVRSDGAGLCTRRVSWRRRCLPFAVRAAGWSQTRQRRRAYRGTPCRSPSRYRSVVRLPVRRHPSPSGCEQCPANRRSSAPTGRSASPSACPAIGLPIVKNNIPGRNKASSKRISGLCQVFYQFLKTFPDGIAIPLAKLLEYIPVLNPDPHRRVHHRGACSAWFPMYMFSCRRLRPA